jgi:stage II sporulation protein AB (anti-sigma F factor)
MPRTDQIAEVPRGSAQLRLCVPVDPKMARVVRDQIRDFATGLGIAGADLIDFVTAIGEALANALVHARATAPIEISAWMGDGDQLCATVRDNGVGFTAPVAVAERTPLPDQFAECGRGMAIMRCCTDRFSVESEPGKGTVVTLARYLRRKSRENRPLSSRTKSRDSHDLG